MLRSHPGPSGLLLFVNGISSFQIGNSLKGKEISLLFLLNLISSGRIKALHFQNKQTYTPIPLDSEHPKMKPFPEIVTNSHNYFAAFDSAFFHTFFFFLAASPQNRDGKS